MHFVRNLLACLTVATIAVGCVGTDPTTPESDAGDTWQVDAAQEDTAQDPCEGVTCSGHGTCVDQSGAEVTCVCDSGYRPEGLSCVELDPDMPCDGVTCSGHGTCNVVEGQPRCTCDDGYESGGDLICVEIDPCEGETCGGFGTCVLDNGNPRCDCDDGYVLSGDLACVEEADPCAGQTCSGNGTCVVSGGAATCQCDPRYIPDGLACRPEDKDGDGEDFTTDCDDDDPSINSSAEEVCDGVDNNCNNQIDEGQACGIWVLEPRSSSWDAYAMDPAASGNAPTSTIRAAWDIESMDIAFVLTDTGYHVLRISSLAWQSEQPLSDIGPNLGEATGPAGSASSVPKDHTGGDGVHESITIESMSGSDKLVWQFKFDTNTSTFSQRQDGLYGDPHVWDDPRAPNPSEIRATWLDVDNSRGWMDADPSNWCDATATSSDPYSAKITDSMFYMSEVGYCFVYTHEMDLSQAPISQPANPPPFDEVGAAFWHQGALYMLRGD